MATEWQPFDTQAQQQQNQNQQSQGQNQSQGSPTSAAPVQNQQNSNQQQATPGSFNQNAPTNSGSYVNLQKYMNANQNFDQNQGGFSGAVTGNINQQSQGAQQNTQAAQNAFQTQAAGNFNAFAQNQPVVSQALADPSQFVQNNPQGAQQFQSVLNAQYTGPSSLQNLSGTQNFANIQNQANAAQQSAQQTQSESGRMALLNQMYGGGGNYNQGAQTLDQMLLQNSPQAQQQFAQTQQQANAAVQGLNQAQSQSQGMAQSYTQQANQMAQNAQQQLTGAGTNLQNTINQQVATDNANAASAYGNVASGVNNNYQLSPDLASQLGLSGNETYGVNLGQYLSQSAPATAANVASGQDYATFNALQQLQGGGHEVGNFLNPADASQAGTYNPYAFNTTAANQAIAQAQTAYQAAIDPTQQGLQSYQQEMNAAGQLKSFGGWSGQELGAIASNMNNTYNNQMATAQYMSANQAAQQTAEQQATLTALQNMANLGTSAWQQGVNSDSAIQPDISKYENELKNLGNNGSYGQYSW